MILTPNEQERLYEILDLCECDNKLLIKRKIVNLLKVRETALKKRLKTAINNTL